MVDITRTGNRDTKYEMQLICYQIHISLDPDLDALKLIIRYWRVVAMTMMELHFTFSDSWRAPAAYTKREITQGR